jgi:serine/threonine protein kinase/WD40 repeat protein
MRRRHFCRFRALTSYHVAGQFVKEDFPVTGINRGLPAAGRTGVWHVRTAGVIFEGRRGLFSHINGSRMNSADRLIELYHAACQHPAGAVRRRYVESCCADDTDLCGQLLSLLEAGEEAGAYLSHSILTEAMPGERPGDRIGHYLLLQKIGEGGCGVVYLAAQEEPVRRRVALKVILPGMDTRQVVARFEAERQALALMDHPNIAKVFDAGATAGGRPFFVMELVPGEKITDYCDRNHLTTEARLLLFTQVCHAIQHAHQKGIIHRDIKPSNILVAENDGAAVPKVIDFGIAKATEQQLTSKTVVTLFEQFIGTPAYMSPEQATMMTPDIDTRSDIYSLGVLLYELLTGKTPFDAEQLVGAGLQQIRRIIREEDPPKPSTRLSTMAHGDLRTAAESRCLEPPQLLERVRGDLDWIVLKCLEKDRTRRYETVIGLARDIEHYLKDEPVLATPPSAWYRFRKLTRRYRVAFTAAAAVLAALMVALAALIISQVRVRRALTASQASEHRARDEQFDALHSQAKAWRYSRRMGQRFESLAAIAQARALRPGADLRDDAIAALAMCDVRPGPVLDSGGGQALSMTWTPNFDLCARMDPDGAIRVHRMADSRELRRFDPGAISAEGTAVHFLVFSPDAALLGYCRSGSKPHVWRVTDGTPVLHDPPPDCPALVFSPDSRTYVHADGNHIVTRDVTNGNERARWQAGGLVLALAFSPDGTRMAARLPVEEKVQVFRTATGEVTADLATGNNSGSALCWHPDGNRLAVAGEDAGIQIWNVDLQRKVATLRGHVPQVTTLSFHPGGGLLASSGWDGTLRLWEPGTGREVIQVPGAGMLQFSTDGRWLGVTHGVEGVTRLFEVGDDRACFTLGTSRGSEERGFYDCAVSPDNRLLAVAMQDGVRIWDLESRREISFLASGTTVTVLFSPDGKSLWTCGPPGLVRWPFTATGGDVKFDPPRSVTLPFSPQRAVASGDGRLLAAVNEAEEPSGVLLVDAETEVVTSGLMPHPNVAFAALSPDGHRLATSGWQSRIVRLWNTKRGISNGEAGVVVHELDMRGPTFVKFTPDGRHLVLSTAKAIVYRSVDTWKEVAHYPLEPGLHPGAVAFSAHGKFMAAQLAPGVVDFKETATGRALFRLEDPFADRSGAPVFSSDGTKLIVLATNTGALRVWDLRAMRASLQPLGMAEGWPVQ